MQIGKCTQQLLLHKALHEFSPEFSTQAEDPDPRQVKMCWNGLPASQIAKLFGKPRQIIRQVAQYSYRLSHRLAALYAIDIPFPPTASFSLPSPGPSDLSNTHPVDAAQCLLIRSIKHLYQDILRGTSNGHTSLLYSYAYR